MEVSLAFQALLKKQISRNQKIQLIISVPAGIALIVCAVMTNITSPLNSLFANLILGYFAVLYLINIVMYYTGAEAYVITFLMMKQVNSPGSRCYRYLFTFALIYRISVPLAVLTLLSLLVFWLFEGSLLNWVPSSVYAYFVVELCTVGVYLIASMVNNYFQFKTKP